MKAHAFWVVSLALAACSTTPVSKEEARPARQILDVAMTQPRAGTGAIVATRDAGFAGSGCDHRIAIDGKDLAVLTGGETVRAFVPPGQHVLSMVVIGKLCIERSTAVTVSVEAGRVHYFRTLYSSAGDAVLMPVLVETE